MKTLKLLMSKIMPVITMMTLPLAVVGFFCLLFHKTVAAMCLFAPMTLALGFEFILLLVTFYANCIVVLIETILKAKGYTKKGDK